MKAASLKEIRTTLQHLSHQEVSQLVLRLSTFKKENKELLSYLLFESESEAHYVAQIKEEVEVQFETINTDSFYYMKKSIRKILRIIKKYIRYSSEKETEVILLLHFCKQLKQLKPSIKKDKVLAKLYHRQLEMAEKRLEKLHEDLQFDFQNEITALKQL